MRQGAVRVGSLSSESIVLRGLALVHRDLGNAADTLRLATEAVAVARGIGGQRQLAKALNALAAIRHDADDDGSPPPLTRKRSPLPMTAVTGAAKSKRSPAWPPSARTPVRLRRPSPSPVKQEPERWKPGPHHTRPDPPRQRPIPRRHHHRQNGLDHPHRDRPATRRRTYPPGSGRRPAQQPATNTGQALALLARKSRIL
jgi:hypothetical protein